MASMMQVISIQEVGDYGEINAVNTLLPDYRFIISEIMQIALWEMVMSVGAP